MKKQHLGDLIDNLYNYYNLNGKIQFSINFSRSWIYKKKQRPIHNSRTKQSIDFDLGRVGNNVRDYYSNM